MREGPVDFYYCRLSSSNRTARVVTDYFFRDSFAQLDHLCSNYP